MVLLADQEVINRVKSALLDEAEALGPGSVLTHAITGLARALHKGTLKDHERAAIDDLVSAGAADGTPGDLLAPAGGGGLPALRRLSRSIDEERVSLPEGSTIAEGLQQLSQLITDLTDGLAATAAGIEQAEEAVRGRLSRALLREVVALPAGSDAGLTIAGLAQVMRGEAPTDDPPWLRDIFAGPGAVEQLRESFGVQGLQALRRVALYMGREGATLPEGSRLRAHVTDSARSLAFIVLALAEVS